MRTGRNSLGLIPWIGLAVALAALLYVSLSLTAARREADSLRTWQAAMLDQIGRATAQNGLPPAPPSPDEASAALGRIVAVRDGALAMAAANPAPPATSAPAPATAASDGHTEIARLRKRKTTGTAAGDAQVIERDSRAAWTGWR